MQSCKISAHISSNAPYQRTEARGKKKKRKTTPPPISPLSHTRRIGGLLSAMRLPLVSQETVWGLLGSPPIPQDWAQLQGVNKIISQPFSLTPHILSGQLVAHPMWLDCLHNMFHALINFIHTHYRLKMENEVQLDLAASPSHSIQELLSWKDLCVLISIECFWFQFVLWQLT